MSFLFFKRPKINARLTNLRNGYIVRPKKKHKTNFTTYKRDDRWPLVMRTSRQLVEWATSNGTREGRERRPGCWLEVRERAGKRHGGSYKTDSGPSLLGIRNARCLFSARASAAHATRKKFLAAKKNFFVFYRWIGKLSDEFRCFCWLGFSFSNELEK